MPKRFSDMTRRDWDRVDSVLAPLLEEYGPEPLARMIDVMVSKIGLPKGREELDAIIATVSGWNMEAR